MENMTTLIKEAFKRLSSKKSPSKGPCPSEEDMACFTSGLLDEKEKGGILEYISAAEDDEAIVSSFLIAPEVSAKEYTKVPAALAARAKDLVPKPGNLEVLEVMAEFAEDMVRLIKTTGTILTSPAVLVPAYRDGAAEAVNKGIEISKAVDTYLINIKIMRIKKNLANLIVTLKNKRTKKFSSGERISLVHEDRELRSSLTDMGEVEFDQIKLDDYQLDVVRAGERYCLARLSLKSL